MQQGNFHMAAVLALMLIPAVLYTTSVAGDIQQAYSVKGKLFCGDAPASRVRVKLFDEEVTKDDLLDHGYTGNSGEFRLQGSTSELTDIDPVLKIYHECNDGLMPGFRKVIFHLPKSYITSGASSEKTFDIGTINLEMKFSDEGRDILSSLKRRRSITPRRFLPYFDEE